MATTEHTRPETDQNSLPTDTEPKISDAAVIAAGASVLFALFEFYVRGNKDRGIFVGHWAPTILTFATYLRKRRTDE